jgi:hypothetical protein
MEDYATLFDSSVDKIILMIYMVIYNVEKISYRVQLGRLTIIAINRQNGRLIG